jgi:DHA3 family macrolide efflux protein-like MFS transporter
MGVAVGGIAIGVWGGFKNKFHTIALSSGLFGVAVISMGLVRNFWLYIGCMAIGGFVVSMCQAPIMSLAQSAIEEEWRGRVMSVFSIIGNLAFPLGMTIWGPLADIVPVGWCLIASGIGMFGISARVARLSYSKP